MIVRDKLGKVKEQGLSLNADAVGRVQNINAFSVCLLARQQKTHDANVMRIRDPPCALAALRPLCARVAPGAEPTVPHRWQPP